jgi:hypothetical protein
MGNWFKPSRIANYIIFIAVLWCIFNNKLWKQQDRIISWDIISYYAYLPATFIYEDVTLQFTNNYSGPHKYVFWPSEAPNGGKVIKTSMGLSFLYAPFFLIGHIAAFLSGADTGGFSAPYKFFLMMGTVFYLMLGLFFLRKLLKRYFNEWITATTLIATVIATNLYYYASIESLMPHVYNFTLIILYLWCTIKWYSNPSIKYTILLGLLTGIISLIRPTNCMVALIFALYNLKNWGDVKQRAILLFSNYHKLLLMVVLCFIVWLPQLLYWKKVTGTWWYYSYGDEHFFFTNPQIIKGLFGFRKGWFLYTPVMLFAIAGIPLLFIRLKEYAWLITIYLALSIYIVLSWWAWWYGGCFGARPFIDLYGLLAFPLALSLKWICEQQKVIKYGLIFIFAFFSVKGVHHTVQYYYGSIHWDSMTSRAYFDSYFRIHPSRRFESLLEHPDYKMAKKNI